MKKVRYGVIRINGIGKLHIRLARKHENVEMAALVDVDAALVKQKSEQLGVRGFTDYRALLDAEIVDAVAIATPHHLHAEIGLACLKAGVHIFMEKPLANRVSEADAMIAAAKANNLKICVAHQYRTHRLSQAIKHLIDTGVIGNILRVLWTWVEFRSESYYARDIWRAKWQYAGGGVLTNQASHDLDLMCWMIGKPVQVSALIGNQLHQPEIEDVACANVLFANGAFACFQSTINQPRGYSVRQIAGDKGMIVIQDVKSLTDDQNDQILLGTYEDALSTMVTSLTNHHEQPEISWQSLKLPNDKTVWKRLIRKLNRVVLKKVIESKPSGHSALLNSFIDAIIKGGEPLVSGESALQAVELINAIVLSAIRKKTVYLPLDREEYDQLFEELSSGKTQVSRFH